jgi:hypothetical protein
LRPDYSSNIRCPLCLFDVFESWRGILFQQLRNHLFAASPNPIPIITRQVFTYSNTQSYFEEMILDYFGREAQRLAAQPLGRLRLPDAILAGNL